MGLEDSEKARLLKLHSEQLLVELIERLYSLQEGLSEMSTRLSVLENIDGKMNEIVRILKEETE